MYIFYILLGIIGNWHWYKIGLSICYMGKVKYTLVAYLGHP